MYIEQSAKVKSSIANMRVIQYLRCSVGLLVWGLVALAGCNKDSALPCFPVEGKVIMGARPLVGGWITFIPLAGDAKGQRPEGPIHAKGFYSLKTAGREGAPSGKYRATISISGIDKDQNSEFNPLYSHWDKSPLIVTVTQDPPAGAYDLKLEPL
jgi:hypothetical protein